MALVAGSPCYAAWRALTARWRDYTAAWRSLMSPLALPGLQAAVPSGALVYGADVQPVSLPAVEFQAAGGRLLRGAGAESAFDVLVVGGGSVNCCSGAWGAFRLTRAVEGCVSASAGAIGVALLLSEATGGAVRPVIAPTARLSRGRLTWRT